MKALLLIIACVCVVQAQPSNIHVAGVFGVSGGLGYSNPQIGVTGGGDFHKRRLGFSVDGSIDRVKKNAGGPGYQITANEAGRWQFTDRFFAEGVARQWHYSVKQFSKSGAEAGAGAGLTTGRGVYSIAYRRMLWETGANANQTIEAKAQWFLGRHIYLVARTAVTRFRSGTQRLTGATTEIQIGFWKGN